MTNSISHKLYIVKEDEYGVTPNKPNFVEVPITGTTLGLTKNSIQSSTIRDDRQITDFRDGTQQIGGDINTELQWNVIDTLIEAALCGAWNTDTPEAGTDELKAGTTRRSFSVLRHFTDLDSSDKPYELYTGVEIINLNLQVSIDSVTTMNFTTIGKSVASSETPPAEAVLNNTPSEDGFDSFTGTLTEDGASLGIATELSLTLENGIEPRFVIGSKETIRPKIGRSNLSGQLGSYFENHRLLDKFYTGSKSSVAITLSDPTGNQYLISVPKTHYTGGQPDVEGNNDIILSMPFQALFDETAASNIVIQRKAV